MLKEEVVEEAEVAEMHQGHGKKNIEMLQYGSDFFSSCVWICQMIVR